MCQIFTNPILDPSVRAFDPLIRFIFGKDAAPKRGFVYSKSIVISLLKQFCIGMDFMHQNGIRMEKTFITKWMTWDFVQLYYAPPSGKAQTIDRVKIPEQGISNLYMDKLLDLPTQPRPEPLPTDQ